MITKHLIGILQVRPDPTKGLGIRLDNLQILSISHSLPFGRTPVGVAMSLCFWFVVSFEILVSLSELLSYKMYHRSSICAHGGKPLFSILLTGGLEFKTRGGRDCSNLHVDGYRHKVVQVNWLREKALRHRSQTSTCYATLNTNGPSGISNSEG